MTIRSMTLGLIAAALVPIGTSVADDGGPNVLQNPGFENQLRGTYATFGNSERSSEITHAGSGFALKTFGCFCSDYNGNGAVSLYSIPVSAGEVYRVGAFAFTPDFDSLAGTNNWSGIKVEFKNAGGSVVSIAEQRILVGNDPDMVTGAWQEASFLTVAPSGATNLVVVPVMLQAGMDEPGATWTDDMSFSADKRDPAAPLINASFDNGVDYSYQTSVIFNAWDEQYGNIFFDDFNYLTPPHSAGLFGTFPDYDGDGQCDPGGVSGLNQLIPGVFEGDLVTISMSSWTPGFDSIVGTDNYVLQKIEFLGSDLSSPLDYVAGVVLDGAGAFNNDTWYSAEISGTAPVGTTSIRIVAQIVQPDCGAGSIRIDNIDLSVESGGGGPTSCVGDFDGNDTVNGADFGVLFSQWGACPGCDADLNEDNFVNGVDVGAFLAVWGDCPGDGGGGGGDEGDCPECDCCEANGNTSCTDAACTEAVCNVDPICCQFGWDSVCASIANEVCNGCEG